VIRQFPFEFRRAFAVLPFGTFRPDKSNGHHHVGIFAVIVHALDGRGNVLVIARISTRISARTPLDLRLIGHDPDVHHVLHGSVHTDTERRHMSLELREAQPVM
jgi:TolB-like protein